MFIEDISGTSRNNFHNEDLCPFNLMHGQHSKYKGTGDRSSVANMGFFSYSGPRVSHMAGTKTFQDKTIHHDLHTKDDSYIHKLESISIANSLCKQSEIVISLNGCTVLDTVLKGLYDSKLYNEMCNNRIVAKYFASVSDKTFIILLL